MGAAIGGKRKHLVDTALAATVRVHGLVLVTRNLKHVSGRGATTLDPFKTVSKFNKAWVSALIDECLLTLAALQYFSIIILDTKG